MGGTAEFLERASSAAAVFDICTGLQQQAYVRVQSSRCRNSFHLLTLQYLLPPWSIRPETLTPAKQESIVRRAVAEA
jgi:hypothetical protein